MPRGNGTGRSGMGPMTGRGMGYCAGYDRPGYMNNGGIGAGFGRGLGGGFGLGGGRGFGRGLGFGLGRAFGYRGAYGPYDTYGAYGAPSPAAVGAAGSDLRKQAMQRQADSLEQELQALRSQLRDLDSTARSTEEA